MKDIGRHLFGAAAVAIGSVGLVSGRLADVWQPVPDFAEDLRLFPYLVAFLFLGGGIAVQWKRTERAGGFLLASLYFFFALLWAKRIILLPLVSATWGGTAEQLALALAALFVALRQYWGSNWRQVPALETSRYLFASCVVIFGVNHFLQVPGTAAMVPAWLPPGQAFWVWLTGVADVAAGLAFVTLVWARIAARLLTLMFVIFGLLVWLPILLSHAAEHFAWCGNALNFALVSAAFVVADALNSSPLPERAPARRRSKASAGVAAPR